jgi:hypothetical protein
MTPTTSAKQRKSISQQLAARISFLGARRLSCCASVAARTGELSTIHENAASDATSDEIDEHLKWAAEWGGSADPTIHPRTVPHGQLSTSAGATSADQFQAFDKAKVGLTTGDELQLEAGLPLRGEFVPGQPLSPVEVFHVRRPGRRRRSVKASLHVALIIPAIIVLVVLGVRTLTSWDQARDSSFELASSSSPVIEVETGQHPKADQVASTSAPAISQQIRAAPSASEQVPFAAAAVKASPTSEPSEQLPVATTPPDSEGAAIATASPDPVASALTNAISQPIRAAPSASEQVPFEAAAPKAIPQCNTRGAANATCRSRHIGEERSIRNRSTASRAKPSISPYINASRRRVAFLMAALRLGLHPPMRIPAWGL